MRMAAVFPKVDSLPGTEEQAAVRDGNGFAGAGERHLDVAGHIIWPLGRVSKIRVVLGYKAVQPSLKVFSGGRICVFHDD